jgi:hypothetical protein
MSKHFGYYDDWKSVILECPRCGWKGTFDQGSVEHHDQLMDSSCPECAWTDAPMLAIVSYPTIQESERNWSRLTESDRQSLTNRKQFLERFEASCLKSPEQLLKLDASDLIIEWDHVVDEGGGMMVLRHGPTEIWREPAFWEGYVRFGEVVDILRKRYGTRLADVVPTHGSELYLYGDSISAHSYVKHLRSALKEGRHRLD